MVKFLGKTKKMGKTPLLVKSFGKPETKIIRTILIISLSESMLIPQYRVKLSRSSKRAFSSKFQDVQT